MKRNLIRFSIRLSLILVLIISILYFNLYQLEKTYFNKALISNEQSVNSFIATNEMFHLLDENGKLNKEGWTMSIKNTIKNYEKINPSSSVFTLLNKIRFKKWSAISFQSNELIGLFAAADLGFVTVMLIHICSIKDKTIKPFAYQKMVLKPLSYLTVNENCEKDCFLFNYSQYNDDIYREDLNESKDNIKKASLYINNDGNYIFKLDFFTKNSNHNIKINMDIKIDKLDDNQSMVLMVPISNDSTLFYYNEKSYCLLKDNIYNSNVNNSISINLVEYSTKNLHFGFDHGRGVWPVKSGWLWMSGHGDLESGEAFGINGGYGFYNPKANFSEDAFFINGKLFKVSSFSIKSNGKIGNMRDYYIEKQIEESVDGNYCDVKFEAMSINENVIDMSLPFLESSFEILYGKFIGICYDNKGNTYKLNEVYGIIENKSSIW